MVRINFEKIYTVKITDFLHIEKIPQNICN